MFLRKKRYTVDFLTLLYLVRFWIALLCLVLVTEGAAIIVESTNISFTLPIIRMS